MIYTQTLKKKLHEAKIINWSMLLSNRQRPEHGDKIIEVWWEYNGSKSGCYDLMHFVGSCDHTIMDGFDWSSRIRGEIETLSPNLLAIALFKRAYKLERQLKSHYPEHQLI